MTTHILLIEDNYTLRRLYARALMDAGFNVTHAEDSATARHHLTNGHYDIAICDVQLTDGIATDLMSEMHALGIPVLAISADETYQQVSSRLNLDGFLQKPIPTRLLAPSVEAILGRRLPVV